MSDIHPIELILETIPNAIVGFIFLYLAIAMAVFFVRALIWEAVQKYKRRE